MRVWFVGAAAAAGLLAFGLAGCSEGGAKSKVAQANQVVVEGTPVTFSTGGRQYIAIVAGGGYNAGPLRIRPDIDQVSGGNMVYVFALPQ